MAARTEARFEAGEVARVELRRLQVERRGFVDEVFRAELAVRTASVALLGLLGADDRRGRESRSSDLMPVSLAVGAEEAVGRVAAT